MYHCISMYQSTFTWHSVIVLYILAQPTMAVRLPSVPSTNVTTPPRPSGALQRDGARPPAPEAVGRPAGPGQRAQEAQTLTGRPGRRRRPGPNEGPAAPPRCTCRNSRLCTYRWTRCSSDVRWLIAVAYCVSGLVDD